MDMRVAGPDIRRAGIWEVASFLFIVAAGSLLHFLYSSTELLAFSWFAPVNESVWEHLKLAIWPAAAFGLVEYLFIRRSFPPGATPTVNFPAARAAQVAVMPLVIVAVFYSYTAFTGGSILAVDILTFVFAALVGQSLSFALLRSSRLPATTRYAALPALALILGVLVVFTYVPPHAGLFQDKNSGDYGLPE